MRVLIFSPDRHIQYDGRTPDETGVGGGITARIRMAAALARLGHQVTCQVNCAQALVHDGVSYIPLAATAPAEVEVLMLNTTGGELDLSAAGELRTQAQLIIVRIGGKPQLNGLETTGYDWIYVVSNFLRGVVVNEWGIAANRVFTAYNGVEERIFRAEEQSNPSRDPFKIAYVGHPNKGLSAAVRVFELLRERDERYQLHLYGGHALWGQPPWNRRSRSDPSEDIGGGAACDSLCRPAASY
jgi:glycosyltransferase involved in cell wall biosynthesis